MPHFAISFSCARRYAGRVSAAAAFACLVIFGCLQPAFAGDAAALPASGSKDYFTLQPADTPLVIRLDAFETEFESRVYDPDNRLLRASGLPAQRLGALYQLIEATDKPRELRIEITSGHSTDRSKLDMQVIRFEPDGPDKSGLIKAYRLLSSGLELETSTRPDAWTMKVITLMQAANFFDLLGMLELQLWSEFYAHFYLLTVLNDSITAAEGAREIYAAATRSGLDDLALAALQLEASATVAQIGGSNKGSADALFGQAQTLFQQAAQLAQRKDYQHEHALAIYHSGLAFEKAGNTNTAFVQFDQAVTIASGCGDTALANQIRQHAAKLHESLGDNTEAIVLMQQISADTPVQIASAEAKAEEAESQEEDELADREMVNYLLEQGRLLEKTFRHREAAEVFRQALQLNQKSESPTLTGPVYLLLAKALYGAGQMDKALEYLQEGIKKTPSYRHETELYVAYGLVASIQRGRGDFAAMAAARNHQQQFLTETGAGAPAAFSFESALDDLAAHGTGSATARALLRQSEQEAKQSGAKRFGQLALLQLCAVGESCTAEVAQQALADVDATGLPGARQQARLLYSQKLHRDGQLTRAMAELDQLIEEMRFFQSYLPGVLGAWYWQNHDIVFNSFMDLVLEQLGPPGGMSVGGTAAIESLRALNRLMRYAQEPAGNRVAPATASEDPELEALRSMIAARESANSSQDAAKLAGEISRNLQQTRKRLSPAAASSDTLSRRLQQLRDDEALLTYYFAAGRAYAWVGRSHGLELVRIPWSADQSVALSQAVEALRPDATAAAAEEFAGLMDRLSQRLLAPIAKGLPQTIYFLPSGRMEGFPLDALRWDGAFLAARHRVINLMSLDDLGARSPRVGGDALQRFFLAGNRQEGAGDFDLRKPPSAEVKEIADLFVGPGLHIVQGAALQWDEFQDDRFAHAGVIHLAIPGTIDLRNPQQSRLLLSDAGADPSHAFLLPQDIESKKLHAALVVLSACDFTGFNPSAFDQNSRFIKEFLHAGAGSVVASLWQVGDLRAAQFMRRFYQELTANPNVSEALSATKRSYLADNGTRDGDIWAAFQLFAD